VIRNKQRSVSCLGKGIERRRQTLFETAKEVVSEIEEPRDWKRLDPGEHPGGRNVSYGFRQMLLVLLLKVYHRKEYREMEARLKGIVYNARL